MPNARRFAPAALLVGGSAVLAGVVVTLATPPYAGARVPAAPDLPWPTTVAATERRLPFALLYVDSHCPHCSRAAVLVDSVFIARGMRAVVVTSDSPDTAAAYERHLGLHFAVRSDSASALMHAIGTRSVPSLVLFHADGSRQLVVGFTHEASFRRVLAEFEP